MRLSFTILIVTCALSLTGCSVVGDMLIGAVTPKRGTSREPGISAKERQARSETERIREYQMSEQRRRWDEQAELAGLPKDDSKQPEQAGYSFSQY